MMSSKDCRALKLFLSTLYKLTALGGLATIVITLDVALSLTVITAAFSIHFLSRIIMKHICPNYARDEHERVRRDICPGSSTRQQRRRPATPIFTGNVTPLRRSATSRAQSDKSEEVTPVSAKVRHG